MIEKVKDSLAFLFQQINAPINFQISYIKQFDDVDDYEIKKTSAEVPLYTLIDENKYKEWDTIFQLGMQKEVHTRIFHEYREFISLIKKDGGLSYDFLIVHIQLQEYSKIGFRDYKKYENFEWTAKHKFPTFLDYLIEQFFYSYREPSLIPYSDIIRRAGELFVVEMMSNVNINFNHDINILSALKYEKSDNGGNLLICTDMDKVSCLLDIKLDSAISLFEYKKIRKLFEVARDDVFLVGTPRKAYGFITKTSLYKINDFQVFQIKIHGAINWELLKFDNIELESISLIQCKDSKYQYSKPKFNEEEFIDIINSNFAHRF
ncbi:MAG: hypothetical protein ACERKN_17410 [Velocimicrobium sp.]